jgi:hypothetical protein
MNTLYCLEEWRGEQRISPPGDNLTPMGTTPPLGPIFRTFFPGKISGKSPRKISPLQNVGKKLNFSAEKVLKNRFSKKFSGKNVRKIGPRESLPLGNK